MTADDRDSSQTPDDSLFGQAFDDSGVESLLHRHFTDELNGQLGRSATFFAEQLLREQRERSNLAAHHAQTTAARPGAWAILRPWAWTVAAGSLAAAAAVVAVTVTSHRFMPSASPSPSRPHGQIVQADDTPDPIDRTVYYRTVDDGTVFLDENTPARQLRRQQVEQVTWRDRRTGKTSVTEMIPKEDVTVVAYEKH